MAFPRTLSPEEIEQLPPAHGVADESHFPLDILGGWIFAAHQPLTSVAIYLNGKALAFVPLWHRPDVGEVYARIPHAVCSGYQFHLPPGLFNADDVNRVFAVGYACDQPMVRQRTVLFADDLMPRVPVPPPSLIELTQGNHDGEQYRRLGYRFYRELLDAVSRHADPKTFREVLDWGCGSGRIAANFLAEPYKPTVCGCDVNVEAIPWCQKNLTRGEFHLTGRTPPLPFIDSRFDLVISLGVVGGFSAEMFDVWLPELKRVLKPGGILALSLQGQFAAEVRFPTDALALLKGQGFLNGSEYDAQHPPGPNETLYRGGFYWMPESIKKHWARHFQILEYSVGGFGSDQDLVIMKKQN